MEVPPSQRGEEDEDVRSEMRKNPREILKLDENEKGEWERVFPASHLGQVHVFFF